MSTPTPHKAKVAIKCLVYNHEPYLRDCLEGFVMQQTDFPFVAIVHDDASTDRSADIIREYAAKYPDIIHPIYETENQYSKKDGSLRRIMDAAIAATEAPYIALCEGDDYWTDPHKLQKQVTFLDTHVNFSMCFHASAIQNETHTDVWINCENIAEKEYFANDIFPQWVIPTASVVYRKSMLDKVPSIKHPEWMKYGDITLFLQCLSVGKVYGLSEKMSVYRMTEQGAVISQRKEKDLDLKMCRHYKFLMLNFPMIDKQYPKAFIATALYTRFRQSKKIKYLCMAFSYSPKYVIAKFLKIKQNGTY